MTALPTELHDLPLQEKRGLLDLLWSDIKTSPGYVPPSWHETVVTQRVAEYRSGKVQAFDFGPLEAEADFRASPRLSNLTINPSLNP